MLHQSVLASLALASVALCQAPETVQVGSKPGYTFREAPYNGAGTTSLAALRGKPVMIEFWGTR